MDDVLVKVEELKRAIAGHPNKAFLLRLLALFENGLHSSDESPTEAHFGEEVSDEFKDPIIGQQCGVLADSIVSHMMIQSDIPVTDKTKVNKNSLRRKGRKNKTIVENDMDEKVLHDGTISGETTPDAVDGFVNIHSHAKGDGDGGDKCLFCDLGANNLVSKEGVQIKQEMIYSNLDDLCDHVAELHCELDEESLKRDGYSVDDVKNKLGKHAKLFRKYGRLRCPSCSVTKSTSRSVTDAYSKLLYHMYEKHHVTLSPFIKLLECDLCSYQTYSEKLLHTHKQYNHSDKILKSNAREKCGICQKTVLRRFLPMHLLVKHNVESDEAIIKPSDQSKYSEVFSCPKCNKLIKGQLNFEKHKKRVHDKVRNFLCHLCSASFFEKKELVNHVYHKHDVNMESKSVIECDVDGCSFTSISNDLIVKHKKVQHSARDYMCHVCSKTFKTVHNLKQHQLAMHPEEGADVYKCPQCAFTSKTKQYVNRHMKIHLSDKKHKCDHAGCDYSSHFSENVKKHKKIHQIKMSPNSGHIQTTRRAAAAITLVAASGTSTVSAVNATPTTAVACPILNSEVNFLRLTSSQMDVDTTSNFSSSSQDARNQSAVYSQTNPNSSVQCTDGKVEQSNSQQICQLTSVVYPVPTAVAPNPEMYTNHQTYGGPELAPPNYLTL